MAQSGFNDHPTPATTELEHKSIPRFLLSFSPGESASWLRPASLRLFLNAIINQNKDRPLNCLDLLPDTPRKGSENSFVFIIPVPKENEPPKIIYMSGSHLYIALSKERNNELRNLISKEQLALDVSVKNDILKEKNKPDKPINNLALTKTFALFRDYCVENKDNIQVLLGGGLTISPDDVENITFTDQTGGFYLNTADKTTAQLQDIASQLASLTQTEIEIETIADLSYLTQIIEALWQKHVRQLITEAGFPQAKIKFYKSGQIPETPPSSPLPVTPLSPPGLMVSPISPITSAFRHLTIRDDKSALRLARTSSEPISSISLTLLPEEKRPRPSGDINTLFTKLSPLKKKPKPKSSEPADDSQAPPPPCP